MRVIHLTHGAGNGVDKACLMTASNMLIGRGEDGDQNSCVCPLLREFIIPTNDAMPEEMLGELYGPLAWEILGTKTEDTDVLVQRALAFADWALREVCGVNCDPIVDERTAYAAKVAAGNAGNAAYATKDTADAAAYAADAAAYAAYAAKADANAAATTAYAAEVAAGNAAYAAKDAAAYAAAKDAKADANAAVWRKCPGIIRHVAAIGGTRPKEPQCVITRDELCEALK